MNAPQIHRRNQARGFFYPPWPPMEAIGRSCVRPVVSIYSPPLTDISRDSTDMASYELAKRLGRKRVNDHHRAGPWLLFSFVASYIGPLGKAPCGSVWATHALASPFLVVYSA